MRRLAPAVLFLTALAACHQTSTHNGQSVPTAGNAGPVYATDAIDQPPKDEDCLAPNPIPASGQMVVTLRFVWGVDGCPEPGSITPSHQGNRRYHDAARRRLLGCRWDPGRLNGNPVRVRMVWLARFFVDP